MPAAAAETHLTIDGEVWAMSRIRRLVRGVSVEALDKLARRIVCSHMATAATKKLGGLSSNKPL